MERAEAVVAAEGLGVRTRRGWIFSGVTLRAEPGAVVAIAGPGGSGRTSLLLTVGGRMRPSAGSLQVDGLVLTGRRAALSRARSKVRARTAIARAGGAAEPEPELRVRDHVRERGLTLRGAARRASGDAFAAACELIGIDLAGKELVGELPAADTTKLALALALMERPAVILLDDLDEGADLAAQRDLWQAVRRASDSGVAVLATTTDAEPAAGPAGLAGSAGPAGLTDAIVTLGESPDARD